MEEAFSLFAAAAELSEDAIIGKTLDGVIVTWNPAAERLYGYSAGETKGRSIALIVPPERVDELSTIMERLRRGERIDQRETVRVDKSGDRIHVSITVKPISDAAGQVIGALAIARNSTRRERADDERKRLRALVAQQQEEIRSLSRELHDQREKLQRQRDELCVAITSLVTAQEQLRKLSHAVEQSPSTVMITNSSGAIEYVNPKFTQLTGYSLTEVIGQNPRILTSGETSPGEYRTLWETITSGGEWRGEFHNKRKNGDLYWEYASISPIKNPDGRITHFVAVKEDITARKQAEMEREQLLVQVKEERRRMEEMVRLIAHDVRQPLTVTLGHVQFLRGSLENMDIERSKKSAEAIEVSTRRVESMIRDLIDSARVEEGHLQLDLQPVEVVQFLRDLLSRLSVALDLRRARVEAAEPVVASADPNRLERIVSNLVSNAVKYADPRGIVRLRVASCGTEALVEVADQGPGVSPEDLPHLFERGFRAAHARKIEGLGLGLYITRLMVEAHGGRIWAESKPGIGSSFYFTLPLATEESALSQTSKS